MRRILFLLVLATAAAAEPYRFEPPAPTSATSVVLKVSTTWRDGCLPQSPTVTRNGKQVDVRWSTPLGFGCITVISPWRTEVPLGLFEPGAYEVTLRVDDAPGETTLAKKTLVVGEFAPSYQLVPPFASTRGGSQVAFRAPVLDFRCGVDAEVRVDGVLVPSSAFGCSVTAFLPAHAPGPVDVVIRYGGTTTTIRSTLRYIDPAAAPDPAVFERILVPIIFSGPGAFGSQWVTEGQIYNGGDFGFPWFPDVAKPACSGSCELEWRGLIPLSAFGSQPNGRILFVPRGFADQLAIGGVVRDVSREEISRGSELPIAREKDFRTEEIAFPNIPVDARYRLMLRIYDLEGVAQAATVTIYRGTPSSGPGISLPITTRLIPMSAPCTTTPCNSARPAYASVDISALIPASVPGPVTVIVSSPSSSAPAPMWALLSITNNTTQQVTTIRPQ